MKNVKEEDVKNFYNTIERLENFFGLEVHIISSDSDINDDKFQDFKNETKIEDISSE